MRGAEPRASVWLALRGLSAFRQYVIGARIVCEVFRSEYSLDVVLSYG
jgi:hypothetical protein